MQPMILGTAQASRLPPLLLSRPWCR
jgi:hypothetical protein